MLKLNIKNETSRLQAVLLGIAKSNGPVPTPEEAYDPKSREHILSGTYPHEENMIKEMEAVVKVFEKHNVKVYRPELIGNCNQIFARDIAFVIDDIFIKSNILPDRDKEIHAIDYLIEQIPPDKVITLPEKAHVEGGDIILYNDYIFAGTYTRADYPGYITARTNIHAVKELTKLFPNKTVKAFDLRKSNTNARENVLHLDCCFQPVAHNKAIIYKDGFLNKTDYLWLVNFFGKENVFEINKEEMYNMFSNIFSISPEVVISDKSFVRLNNWLKDQGMTVEEVSYAEIGKQGGLLRCSTMPLIRE
ncbi:dimethylarginine dimethylaminohydrolase family protein [Abyssalbus ytuae]|uniref:arginine deiminase n=1 Tax=Abyssalbus ytuae TaxID=2926907 RepID=A0A9E7D0V7_9FLAO|nr:arginine deiminase family protein [Abyssalbus ytuae]UOB16418.1 arginine deiminase family protein [Abyssalbus ytuae]